MKTKITLFALALALPLAACADEADVVETDAVVVETPDVDATMDNMGDDMDNAMDNAGAEMNDAANDAGATMEEAGNDIEAAADEAGAEIQEADDNM